MTAREDYTATLTTLRSREATQPHPEGMVVRVVDARGDRVIPMRGTRVLGGRLPNHPVSLPHASVSATHFELASTDEGAVLLRDLGSKNGTRVQGVRIREAFLEPGTRFSAGDVELELSRIEVGRVPVSFNERFGDLMGRGIAMGKLFAQLDRLAELSFDVLVRGETGTGKELVARALHERSARAKGPFVVLDCTALPASLAESLLFGHRRGAFTGASEDTRGFFEEASGGTLFIDEIAKLPIDLQGKLLRALENRHITRVGETRARPIDVRIVAATNRDLARMMAEEKVLEDLYYRLGGIEIELPPLRDRGRPNLEYLAGSFLERIGREQGRLLTITPEAYATMDRYGWPGNVRELVRVLQRATFWAEGDVIEPRHLRLPEDGPRASRAVDDLFALPYKDAVEEFESLYLQQIWPQVDGNLSEAARRMGIDRRTLTKRVEKLGLRDTGDAT